MYREVLKCVAEITELFVFNRKMGSQRDSKNVKRNDKADWRIGI